jgi:hypothetical protein
MNTLDATRSSVRHWGARGSFRCRFMPPGPLCAVGCPLAMLASSRAGRSASVPRKGPGEHPRHPNDFLFGLPHRGLPLRVAPSVMFVGASRKSRLYSCSPFCMSSHTFPMEDNNRQGQFPIGRGSPTPMGALSVNVIFTKTHPIDGHYAFVELGSVNEEGNYEPLAVVTADTASHFVEMLRRAITATESLDHAS